MAWNDQKTIDKLNREAVRKQKRIDAEEKNCPPSP